MRHHLRIRAVHLHLQYSAFFDAGHFKSTGLHEELQRRGVTSVYVVGLAADFCVKFTAADAVALGYTTWLVQDATRATDPEALPSVVAELQAQGVRITSSEQLLHQATEE